MSANFQRVMLATDLREPLLPGWAHALKISLNSAARLTLLHVHDDDKKTDWTVLPTARNMLQQWRVLEEDAPVQDFLDLGLHVRLVSRTSVDVRSAVERQAAKEQPDLIVLGTHKPSRIKRLLEGSVGEFLTRHSHTMTLVVPDGVKPLVDVASGDVGSMKILIPIDGDPGQQQTVDAAERFVTAMRDAPAQFVFIHTGGSAGIPDLRLPERSDWVWTTKMKRGLAPVRHILDVAAEEDASLIVMRTHGHNSLADALMGSHTERVLRSAPCPVLVVPAL